MPKLFSFLFVNKISRRRLLHVAAPVLSLMAAPAVFAKTRRVKAGGARRYPLRPGEFFWMPQVAINGPVVAVVNIHTQMVQVFRNGVGIGVSSVSTGKPGYATPVGMYPVLEKKRFHRSSTYDNAPMPYMLRLTWMGVALHVGNLPGYPASHGCIRLPAAFAPKLFGVVGRGDRVWVVNRAVTEPMAMLAPITPAGTALLSQEAHTQQEYWDSSWLNSAASGQVAPAAPVDVAIPTTAQVSSSVATPSSASIASMPATASPVIAPAPVVAPVQLGVVVSLSQKRLYVLHQGCLVAALALPESLAQTKLEGGAVWSWRPPTVNTPGQWLEQAPVVQELIDLPEKILPPSSSFVQRLYPRMAAGSLLFVSQLPATSDLHFAVPPA